MEAKNKDIITVNLFQNPRWLKNLCDPSSFQELIEPYIAKLLY